MPAIDYRTVRTLKHVSLRRAFDHFLKTEWASDSARATALRSFAADNAWWLDDYALFRALHARYEERAWTDWPEQLRRREPQSIEHERRALHDEILFRTYVQWIADDQWRTARRRANGVALFGDLPFMVDGDSADVWVRPGQFRMDATIGAPPDAFSAEGQDWGTPVYDWSVVARDNFEWLHKRARRCARKGGNRPG